MAPFTVCVLLSEVGVVSGRGCQCSGGHPEGSEVCEVSSSWAPAGRGRQSRQREVREGMEAEEERITGTGKECVARGSEKDESLSLLVHRVYDMQFMDVVFEVEAHDAEVLCIEYSPEYEGERHLPPSPPCFSLPPSLNSSLHLSSPPLLSPPRHQGCSSWPVLVAIG